MRWMFLSHWLLSFLQANSPSRPWMFLQWWGTTWIWSSCHHDRRRLCGGVYEHRNLVWKTWGWLLLWFSPFSFILLYFLILIPFHSDRIPFPFPHHFSTRLSSFPLSMTHKPWGLLLLLFLHCLMTHTDSLSPRGCTSPLFPFRMTSYDSTLIFYRTTLCPTIYV